MGNNTVILMREIAIYMILLNKTLVNNVKNENDSSQSRKMLAKPVLLLTCIPLVSGSNRGL
jgi:hypothetical protein